MSPYRSRPELEHHLGARWGVTLWRRMVVRVRRAMISQARWRELRKISEPRQWARYQRDLEVYRRETEKWMRMAEFSPRFMAVSPLLKPLPPLPPPRYILE